MDSLMIETVCFLAPFFSSCPLPILPSMKMLVGQWLLSRYMTPFENRVCLSNLTFIPQPVHYLSVVWSVSPSATPTSHGEKSHPIQRYWSIECPVLEVVKYFLACLCIRGWSLFVGLSVWFVRLLVCPSPYPSTHLPLNTTTTQEFKSSFLRRQKKNTVWY